MATERIKCFAINVEKNTYRRDYILGQSDKAGLPIHIFKAITPDTRHTVPHRYDEKKSRRFTGRGMLPTEIACGLSHIQLWRDLLNDPDHDYYLILEDDIHIQHSFAEALANVDLSKIGLLKLSGQCPRPMRQIRRLSDTFALYRYAYGPLDAAAYVINKNSAQKMIDYCETLHTPIDILMDRSYDHGVTVYGVLPYAAETKFCFDEANPLLSDIGRRDHKYAPDITWHEKFCVRLSRITGSLRRKWAALCLKTRLNKAL